MQQHKPMCSITPGFSGALRINLNRAAVVALAQAEYLQDDQAMRYHSMQLEIMDKFYGLSHLLRLEALEEAKKLVFDPVNFERGPFN